MPNESTNPSGPEQVLRWLAEVPVGTNIKVVDEVKTPTRYGKILEWEASERTIQVFVGWECDTEFGSPVRIAHPVQR